MKKFLSILMLAALLLLAGCGEEVPLEAMVADTGTEPTGTVGSTDPTQATEPQGSGVYFIKDQIYVDSSGHQMVRMTTTLNDAKLPKAIFLDSGKDVTHTIFYDEQGLVTGFQQNEFLYGEDHISVYKVNDRGDVIQHTTEAGSESESTLETVYKYDDQGNMIQKDQTKNGNFYYSETAEYDEHGNLTKRKTISQDSTEKNYVYTNTYKDDLLVKTVQTVDDTVAETVTYTYNDQGLLIGKNVNGKQIYTYSYSDAGVLKELVLTNGNYTKCCECNEKGQIVLVCNYTNGNLTSKVSYVWEEFAAKPTDAQLNVYDQLGIIN